MTGLTMEFTEDGERCVLALTGELDIDSVADVREAAHEGLAGGRYRTLVLDLGGLTFIDSSGLGLLIELRRLGLSAEVGFEIRNVAAGPARVIAIAGLTETFGLPSP